MALKPAIALLVILSSFGAAAGATIHGNVYEWATLEPLNDVIVEVNTVPAQSMVVKSGSYAFQVSPGNYTIKAKYFKNNLLEYYTEENISVIGEGDFVLDLVMFPALDIEEFFEAENLSFEEIFQDTSVDGQETSKIWLILALILFSLGVAYYISSKRRGPLHVKTAYEALPEDLREVLELLDKNSGRMTQKVLRKNLDLSEAKVSLMITDLESRGLVRRVKKGRGNIIIRRK